jgi:3-oxoacyl-[acyl-carrier-protein] synthase III
VRHRGGGRIIAFANPTDVAAPTRLLHSADGSAQYVDFDPVAGRTTRVTFGDSALTLVVGDAPPVTARRG